MLKKAIALLPPVLQDAVRGELRSMDTVTLALHREGRNPFQEYTSNVVRLEMNVTVDSVDELTLGHSVVFSTWIQNTLLHIQYLVDGLVSLRQYAELRAGSNDRLIQVAIAMGLINKEDPVAAASQTPTTPITLVSAVVDKMYAISKSTAGDGSYTVGPTKLDDLLSMADEYGQYIFELTDGDPILSFEWDDQMQIWDCKVDAPVVDDLS